MIRDDWSGLIDAPRWWHLEGGLVVYGILKKFFTKRGLLLLDILIPREQRLLRIRARGVVSLSIPESTDDARYGQADV